MTRKQACKQAAKAKNSCGQEGQEEHEHVWASLTSVGLFDDDEWFMHITITMVFTRLVDGPITLTYTVHHMHAT